MSNYTPTNLPAIVPVIDCVAHPKPGATVAACQIQEDGMMTTPWGQNLKAKEGDWHNAQDAEGDHYPNFEFDDFYELGEELTDDEPRAKYLRDHWRAKGFEVTVYLATKTKHVIIVGICTEEGIFENCEGTAPFSPGDFIVKSPFERDCTCGENGHMWVVRMPVFYKKYIGIQKNED